MVPRGTETLSRRFVPRGTPSRSAENVWQEDIAGATHIYRLMPLVHWLRTVSHSPSDPSHEVVQGCATFVENWRVHPDICRLKLEPHMRRSGDRTMVHLSLSSTAPLPRSIYWDPGFRIDWAKSPRRGFSSRVPAQNARQQIHYRTKFMILQIQVPGSVALSSLFTRTRS